MSLSQIIQDKIEATGPISIADYMELALAHPEYGYYTTNEPFGTDGDFITAPEISQIFGELLGLWCVDMWQRMEGGPIALVELGPGRGTLMQDILRATRNMGDFHDHLTIHMVESSPKLSTIQYQRLRNEHPRIEWIDQFEQVPKNKPALVIANEFFDALPIKQHVKTPDGIQERLVGYNDEADEFEFVLGNAGLSLAKGGGVMKDGTIIESCPLAKQITGEIAAHINAQGGAGLFIDYGYLGDAHQDTLQAVRNHAFAPVLKDPGKADITAHVDFRTLMEVAENQGVVAHGTISQGTFLLRLGAEVRAEKLLRTASPEQAEYILTGIKRLISPHEMGELFKVMSICSNHALVPAGFSHVSYE